MTYDSNEVCLHLLRPQPPRDGALARDHPPHFRLLSFSSISTSDLRADPLTRLTLAKVLLEAGDRDSRHAQRMETVTAASH